MTLSPHDVSDAQHEETAVDPPKRTRRRAIVIAAVSLAGVSALAIAAATWSSSAGGPAAEAAAQGTASGPDATGPVTEATTPLPPPPELSPEQIAELPAAVYDAVIPGLVAYSSTDMSAITHSYTVASDAPLFGADHETPVARVPASNFLGDPTIVVPVQLTDDWALVMTPSRQVLPSEAGGDAPAQTVGWMPRAVLMPYQQLDARIVVSESAQTLTIVRDGESTEFAIGVGTPETPTPTGTTGYIQARYDDPSQTEYTIQLTSLHATAADEPFGGQDGGLIGVHYNGTNTGAVSHGCIRLSLDALIAVNRLPLGTPLIVEG